jgi:O-antigen/teichoic acid export membrane protein
VLTEESGDRMSGPGPVGRLRKLSARGGTLGTVVGLTAISDWLPKFISFLTMLLVARLLGAAGFAVFALAQAWIGYGWAAVDLGQAGYSVRTLAGRSQDEETRLGYEIFGLYLVLAVSVTAGLVVALRVSGLGDTDAGHLVVLMTPFLVSYALLPDWWLRARGQLGILGAANGAAVLCFLLAVALLPAGHAQGYAIAYGVAPLAAALVAWLALARRGIRPRLVMRWRAWRSHLRYSMLFATAGAAAQVPVPLTLLGMTAAGDEAATGAYAVGLRIAAASAGALWLLVQNALPRLLASQRRITVSIALAATLPGLAGLISGALLWRPLLAPLLGPSFADLGAFVALGLVLLMAWGAKSTVEMGLIAAYADRARIVMNVVTPLAVGAVLVTGLAGRHTAVAPVALLGGEAVSVIVGLVLLRRTRTGTTPDREAVADRPGINV